MSSVRFRPFERDLGFDAAQFREPIAFAGSLDKIECLSQRHFSTLCFARRQKGSSELTEVNGIVQATTGLAPGLDRGADRFDVSQRGPAHRTGAGMIDHAHQSNLIYVLLTAKSDEFGAFSLADLEIAKQKLQVDLRDEFACRDSVRMSMEYDLRIGRAPSYAANRRHSSSLSRPLE